MACKTCGSELTYHDAGYFCMVCHNRERAERRKKNEERWSWLVQNLEQIKDQRVEQEDRKMVDELISHVKRYF